jgi:hypothetical protein
MFLERSGDALSHHANTVYCIDQRLRTRGQDVANSYSVDRHPYLLPEEQLRTGMGLYFRIQRVNPIAGYIARNIGS